MKRDRSLPPPPLDKLTRLYKAWHACIGSEKVSAGGISAARNANKPLAAAIGDLGITRKRDLGNLLRRAMRVDVPGFRLVRDFDRHVKRWEYQLTQTSEKPIRPPPKPRKKKAAPVIPAIIAEMLEPQTEEERAHLALATAVLNAPDPARPKVTLDFDPVERDIAHQAAAEAWRRDVLDPRPAPVPTVAPAEMHDPAPRELWAGPFDTRDAANGPAQIIKKMVCSMNAAATAEVVALDGFFFAVSSGASHLHDWQAQRAIDGCLAVRLRTRRGRFGRAPTPAESRDLRAPAAHAGFNPERDPQLHRPAPARKAWDPRD